MHLRSTSRRGHLAWLVPALLGVCLAAPASADVVFQVGNVGSLSDENVLFDTQQSGFEVFGRTNQTSTQVKFSTTPAAEPNGLLSFSVGQARVEEALGGPLNFICFEVVGGSFTSAVMNPFFGRGTAFVDVFYRENGNAMQKQFQYALGNGENFSTSIADAVTVIDKICITAPDGFTDLRQVRLGFGSTAGALVPEPVSLALVLPGLLPLGLLLRRRIDRRCDH
jgi:hypothetical protein